MILAALILQAPPAALSPKAFQARCAEFSQAKDWKGLEGAARAQLTAAPKDAAAYSALGYALFAQNRDEEGRVACEEAIKQDPRLINPYLYLGMSFAIVGDQKSVLEIGNRLAIADPFGAMAYYKVPALFRAAVGETSLDILPDAEPLPYSIRFAAYQRVDGAAVFDLTIGPDGRPTEIKPLAGPEHLIAAGAATVHGFVYKPLIKGGKAVAFHAPGVLMVRVRP